MAKNHSIGSRLSALAPAYYRQANALVAAALLALSLRHQAFGVSQTTGVPQVEGWLMAIGIDLAMIAAELAILSGVRSSWARVILVATLGISAGFNVLGFWQEHGPALNNAIAAVLGVFVPAAIYGLLDTVNRRVPRAQSQAKRIARARAAKIVAIR